MTDRMRMVLAGAVVVLVAALLWTRVVVPAREDADSARAEQTAAETQAAAVDGRLAEARQAAERAPANVRTLKRLAVAVPEKVEAPALIDQLDRTAKRYDVTFDVLKVSDGAASASTVAGTTGRPTTTGGTAPTGGTTSTGGAAGTGGAATPAAAGAPAADAGAAAAPGSVPVALNVEIAGRYTAVTRFVAAIQADVRGGRGGALRARGRLLRVSGIDLKTSQEPGDRTLSGTLDVVAYLLPAETAAAASAAGPNGAAPAPATGAATTTATPSPGSRP
jgi:hypothetical protein